MSAADGTDPAWRPNEDAATIHSEETWLQGAFVAAVAYGAVAVLCAQCFFMLMRGFKRSKLMHTVPLLLFVFLMFALNTVYIATTIQFTQQAFIDFRNFDGGPSAYEIVFFSIPIDAAANDCLVVTTMLADALLLWRCTVIYANSSVNNLISFGLAGAFWVTEIILGTLFLVALTSTSVFGTVNLTLGFWCFSLALNIIATLLIVGRLVYHRYQLKRVLGSQHASHYTSFIATIVESELLYTCYLILYIVPFVRNNTLVNAFIQGPSVIQSVSAMMIVYRVADGKAWSKNTWAEVTTGIPLNNMSGVRATDATTFEDGTTKTLDSAV
jgi:hypothetical protein